MEIEMKISNFTKTGTRHRKGGAIGAVMGSWHGTHMNFHNYEDDKYVSIDLNFREARQLIEYLERSIKTGEKQKAELLEKGVLPS